MEVAKLQHRLESLYDKHKKQHQVVEVLEAEKAPASMITKAKKEKLKLKDEITRIENQLHGA